MSDTQIDKTLVQNEDENNKTVTSITDSGPEVLSNEQKEQEGDIALGQLIKITKNKSEIEGHVYYLNPLNSMKLLIGGTSNELREFKLEEKEDEEGTYYDFVDEFKFVIIEQHSMLLKLKTLKQIHLY